MIITDNFSGPVRAIDPVSVRLCVQTVTFERNDHLKPIFMFACYSSPWSYQVML